jgi:type IV pilus assembly protein PilA
MRDTKRLPRRSFTLVELMIIIGIVALLAALSIPNLIRSRLNANESATVGTLHMFSNALQSFYAAAPGTGYPVALTALAPAGQPSYVSLRLAVLAPSAYGYNYTYTRGIVDASGVGQQFHLYAAPAIVNFTGRSGFYLDEQGIICTLTPPAGDPGHAPAGNSCPAGYTPVSQ